MKLIIDNFSRHAVKLRQVFDRRFQDPHGLDQNRFVWDYWHVPDQYTLVRTPAYHYFAKSLYMKFHRELLFWGRRTLGCWDISPPWLSYYVEGCKQELHSDVPHGPWAFVYALTPKKIQFKGGETLILKPEVLNYWNNFGHSQNREVHSFVDKIPSRFNRLVVFDPRYPHGVTEVRGTHDPRQARLVIHGWFTEPKTYVEGPLPSAVCERVLNHTFDQLSEVVGQFPATQGTVSLQLTIKRSGQVAQAKFRTNTLIHTTGESPAQLNHAILRLYRSLELPSARTVTHVTVPLIFS